MEGEKAEWDDSPRSPDTVVPSSYIKPQGRKPHDPAVTFEEYHYYAQRTRAEEAGIEPPKLNWREIVLRKKTGHDVGNQERPGANLTAENFTSTAHRPEISDEEWTNASRMFRTASWGACKFLSLLSLEDGGGWCWYWCWC